jgi:hypothetical protein
MGDILFGLFFILSFLIFGVFLIWSAISRQKRINRSRSWPNTMGMVVAAKNKVSFGTKGGRSYRPEVTYRYSVIGIEYQQTISINSTIIKDNVEEFLKNLTIGAKLKISYNPDNPKDCVSEYDEVGVPWLGIGAIAFGVLMIFVSIFGK